MTTQFGIGLTIGFLPRFGQANSGGGGGSSNAHIATVNAFTRDQVVFDSGEQIGLDSALVPLSGTTDAPDGAVIQARAVSLEDGGAATTAWVDIATASGGTWSGSLPVLRAPTWYRGEVRVDASSETAQMTTTFGVGHVWAVWEQSNWARIFFDYSSAIYDTYPSETVNPGDVQVWHFSKTLPSETRAPGAYDGDVRVTPAMHAFANSLQKVRPGEKFMILGHVKGGTSYFNTLDPDDTDDRAWSDELALHSAATANGERVGVAWNNGWAADQFSLDYVNSTLQYFIGKSIDGTPHDPSAASPWRGWSANTTYGADHGGLYDWTYTKFGYAGPHGRVKGDSQFRSVGAATIADFSELAVMNGTGSADDNIYNTITSELNQVFNGGDPAFPELLPWVGTTHGAERGSGIFGNGDDYGHMRAGDPLGRVRLAQIGAHHMMQTLGWMSAPMPYLDSRYDEPAGAWSDQWIDGNNTLTTLRLAQAADGTLDTAQATPTNRDLSVSNGATIPTGEDHRTEVMGWLINRAAAQRAELHTVTAAEVAAGHPAAEGQVVCRVWPNFGGTFSNIDEIIYGFDQMPGYLVSEDGNNLLSDPTTRQGNRTFMDYLQADMGQPRGMFASDVVPVVHQQKVWEQATTLAAPSLFRVTTDTTFQSATIIPASTYAALAVEIKGKYDALTTTSMPFTIRGNKLMLFEVRTSGTVNIKDNLSGTTNSGLVLPNVFFHFRMMWDRENGGIRIYDGSNGNELRMTGVAPSGGTVPNREVYFFDGTNNDGVFEFLRATPITSAELAAADETSDAWWEGLSPHYAVEAQAEAPYYTQTGGMTLSGTAPGPAS